MEELEDPVISLHRKKISVKHVNWQETTMEELKRFFQQFGSVFSVEKGRKRDNNGMPEVFVTFANAKDSSKVLHFSSEQLNFKNRVLRVEFVNDDAFANESSATTCEEYNEDEKSTGEELKETENETILLNSLPTELISHILSFLAIDERIRLERVCRRWRALGTEFPWSDPKCIYFNECNQDTSTTFGTLSFTDKTTDAILSRCGAKLRSLSLPKVTSGKNPISVKVLNLIADHCPNLVELTVSFSNLAFTGNCLENISERCKCLRVVDFTFYRVEKVTLKSFFKNCQLLERLSLTSTDLSLLHLDLQAISKSLKAFSLCTCYNFESDALFQLTKRCGQLLELQLLAVDKSLLFNPELMGAALRNCNPNLKVLKLTDYCNINIDWCFVLSFFLHLEELHIAIRKLVPYPGHENHDCFKVISTKLKIFHAAGRGQCFYENIVTRVLKRNDKIESMYLHGEYALSYYFITLCQRYRDSLSQLTLTCQCQEFKTVDWCKLFSTLPSLVRLELDFSSNEFNNEVAVTISSKCRKLKMLKFGHFAITDAGLCSISGLRFLTELHISNLESISDDGIRFFSLGGRLEVLRANNVYFEANITDESCCFFARCCPKLRLLELEQHEEITDTLIDAFCEAFKKGYLKQNVTLSVRGTSVSLFCQKHPRLTILGLFD